MHVSISPTFTPPVNVKMCQLLKWHCLVVCADNICTDQKKHTCSFVCWAACMANFLCAADPHCCPDVFQNTFKSHAVELADVFPHYSELRPAHINTHRCSKFQKREWHLINTHFNRKENSLKTTMSICWKEWFSLSLKGKYELIVTQDERIVSSGDISGETEKVLRFKTTEWIFQPFYGFVDSDRSIAYYQSYPEDKQASSNVEILLWWIAFMYYNIETIDLKMCGLLKKK